MRVLPLAQASLQLDDPSRDRARYFEWEGPRVINKFPGRRAKVPDQIHAAYGRIGS